MRSGGRLGSIAGRFIEPVVRLLRALRLLAVVGLALLLNARLLLECGLALLHMAWVTSRHLCCGHAS